VLINLLVLGSLAMRARDHELGDLLANSKRRNEIEPMSTRTVVITPFDMDSGYVLLANSPFETSSSQMPRFRLTDPL
jgi:hypothetical protein